MLRMLRSGCDCITNSLRPEEPRNLLARPQGEASPSCWKKQSFPQFSPSILESSGRKRNLVGGWATPLKNMKVSWDDDIPNIWENKIHGNQTTNHQPDFQNQHTMLWSFCFLFSIKSWKIGKLGSLSSKSMTWRSEYSQPGGESHIVDGSKAELCYKLLEDLHL